MAGLVAAVRARALGLRPVVLEKGERPGGSMLLSSGVVWRYRSLGEFRAQCPGGDPRLQAAIVERLDDALRWLESLGAPVVARDTENSLTVGWRFDPAGLTRVLVHAAGDIRLHASLPGDNPLPIVLATGGFQGNRDLLRLHVTPWADDVQLRANRWSEGDGLVFARTRGAATTVALDEFNGRNMPDAPVGEHDFVHAAQLYARHALVLNEDGDEFLERPVSWSETDVVQATARQPRATAWYVLTDAALSERVRGRAVRDMVAAAEAAGGTVVSPRRLPFRAPARAALAVRVRAAITHTIGGLRVDEHSRVLDGAGRALDALYAAGVDVGGVAAGGYASGLAQALVLGLSAAEAAAAA